MFGDTNMKNVTKTLFSLMLGLLMMSFTPVKAIVGTGVEETPTEPIRYIALGVIAIAAILVIFIRKKDKK